MKKSDKLEKIKQSLNNSEDLVDIKNNPIVKVTILSVIKAVPILGDLIDSSLDNCLTIFQENKRNELIKLILSNVNITSDMVNDVEFILNFAKTLEAVNRLSSNDKIRYFANLVKNGYFTANKVENDLFEEHLRLLTTLSFREIEYLYFLYQYQNKHFGKSNKKGEYTRDFGLEFSNVFNCGRFDYIDVYDKLAATGWDNCLTIFQENKRNELIKLILSNVNITSDMVNDVEFILNFAKTLEAVNRLSSNDKIRYFANLVKNGYFTANKVENDLFEEHLRLLTTLSFREIEYLYFLYQYQNKHFGKSNKKGEYTRDFGLEFSNVFNCGRFDYIDVYDKLAATGCVQKFYIGYASQIEKIHDGYYEDYQMSDIEVDIDYYYINEGFVHFLQMISDKEI